MKRSWLWLLSALPLVSAPAPGVGHAALQSGSKGSRTDSRASAAAKASPTQAQVNVRHSHQKGSRILGDGGGVANPSVGWYRGDLHFHSNYSDDALDQGGDWVGPALRIAEYYGDPVFQQTYPEYVSNAMDFVALTDHRTVEGTYDLDFHSDKLILIPGEEFGNTGHANALNITRAELSDPVDGRSPNEQIQFAIDDTQLQGGLFSINHPAADDDMWFWDVTGYESAEVWNLWVSFQGQPTSEEVLDNHVANYGVENRFIRRALRENSQGVNGQYKAFYEANLIAGIHLAAVGGGDRHMLVMPGHPTTYIQANTATSTGLMEGIRAGRTFVSRSPAGPQVLLGAVYNGKSYMTGASLPSTATVTVTAQVSRADKGLLRIIQGPIQRDITRDEMLELPTLGEVLFEVPITGNTFSWQTTFTPPGESWIYAEVLESADYSTLPADVQKDLDALTAAMQSYGQRYGQLVHALLPMLDPKTLVWPGLCKPEDWDPYRTACVDVDDAYLGTIHIAEPVDRILNLYREDGVLTDYAEGAISSPIFFEH